MPMNTFSADDDGVVPTSMLCREALSAASADERIDDDESRTVISMTLS